MRVLLDTNMLLDSLLQRAAWAAEADLVLQAGSAGKIALTVSALTVANVFYITRKVLGTAKARLEVRRMLAALDVLPVDHASLVAADAMAGSDFEDNLQIAAAVAGGLDAIVTRNPADFAHSPIPVFSPAQLLAQLSP